MMYTHEIVGTHGGACSRSVPLEHAPVAKPLVCIGLNFQLSDYLACEYSRLSPLSSLLVPRSSQLGTFSASRSEKQGARSEDRGLYSQASGYHFRDFTH